MALLLKSKLGSVRLGNVAETVAQALGPDKPFLGFRAA